MVAGEAADAAVVVDVKVAAEGVGAVGAIQQHNPATTNNNQ